jgi:hypothetical protein
VQDCLPGGGGNFRRAVYALGQEPSGGPPSATKFEDSTVIANLGVNPSVHAGPFYSSVMTFFFIIWPEYFKKNVMTLQLLRLQLKNFISSKSIMQLPNTISLNSAIFMKKKSGESTVTKLEIWWRKLLCSYLEGSIWMP